MTHRPPASNGTLCPCGQPTSGAVLCTKCQRTLSYALVNIGLYWGDLRLVVAKQTRYSSAGGGKGSVGKTHPLPLDMRFVNQTTKGALDEDPNTWPTVRGAKLAPGSQLRWDVFQALVTLCRQVMRGQRAISGPSCQEACLHTSCAVIRRRRHVARNVPGMVRYLALQHRWLVSQDWAPQVLEDLVTLERRLSRMVDRPADRWYAGRCSAPTIGKDADGADTIVPCEDELYATTDSGTIRCRADGCGAEHDVAVRREFLLREAADYLVTATEAAGALLAWTDYDGSESKLIDRIRNWSRPRDDRGGHARLATRSTVKVQGRDRALFRLGDIQVLLVDDAQTRQSRRIGA